MASNWSLCGVCETLGQSMPSTVWCVNCDEALCIECQTRHLASKGSNEHQMTPIEVYQHLPTDVLKISNTCPEHNKRYQTYCGKHECACCLTCTFGKHKECKDMLSIDDVVGGVKNSNALTECEAKLEENKKNVAMIIEDRRQNLSSIKQETIKIQAKIRETRRKLNEHLDKLETQMLHELKKLEELHTSKIQALVASLEKKEQDIKEMRSSLSALKDIVSDLQIFLSMKRTEKLTLSDDEFLQSLSSSEDMNHISLSLELDKTLPNIENSLPTFGRVSTKSIPCSVVLKKRKDKQAQLHVPSVRSIDSIRLDLIRSIDVKTDCLYGCCFLPDGRFAVTCLENICIKVMREDGTVDCQINAKPYGVIDITHIPSTNTLAVTSTGDDNAFINIVNIDSRKIIRSIPTNTKNEGITYKDGDLFYCANDVGICRMNVDSGEITTTKKIPDMSEYSYITTHQDKLYFTTYNTHTVTCCSMDGTTKWEFKDEKVLCYPQGISIDANGYVYVVGCDSNNLIVISPDGDRHCELLNREDGLSFPYTVDYDRNTNRILVINLENKLLFYKVN